MTSEDKWNLDETWDGVADGPLPPGQLAELVAACERRPELWKRCALALLEEQVLRHELQTLTRQHLASARPGESSGRGLTAPLPCPAPAQPIASASQSATVTPTSSESVPRTAFWNNLALAAAVTIAFGIGWQSSQRFGATRGSDATTTNSDLIARSAVAERESLNSMPAQATPVFGNPAQTMLANTAEPDREVIDQVNAETLYTTVRGNLNEDLDPEYQQLRQRGYEVEAQDGLMPVWLYDGRPAVVPYKQIKVRSKSPGRSY